jgi:hypothetical protein
VVLRQPAGAGRAPIGSRHVRQPERRRSDEVALRAGPGPPVAHADELSHRQPAPHLAGDAAQQDRRVLGRAEAVPGRHVVGERKRLPQPAGLRIHLRRHGDDRARGRRHRRRRHERRVCQQHAARPAGDVVLAGDQPLPARGRLRHLPRALWQQRGSGQSDAPHGPRHRAVRGRMRAQRWHRQPDLPLAQLGGQLDRRAHVARVGVVRDRRAQHEVRLSGRTSRLRSDDLHERPVPRLPREQRHTEPAHADADPVRSQGPRPLRRVLRAGAVDARPHDAAGRVARRSRVELLPRAARRADAVPHHRARVPGDRGRQGPQRCDAARGRRLRSVRQRANLDQGERREVPRSRERAGDLFRLQPGHAHLDRRVADVDGQRQLRAGLRPVEPGTC